MNPPAHGRVDAVKIAAEARSIHDSLRLLRLARRSKRLSPFRWGSRPAGAHPRLRDGSELAYAPVAEATATARFARPDEASLPRTRAHAPHAVYGVIGDPVGHSLSPLLHNTGFATRSVDAVYLPFLVRQLGDFLAVFRNLVSRFQRHPATQTDILKHLRECEPLAADIGAVIPLWFGATGRFMAAHGLRRRAPRAGEKTPNKGSRTLISGRWIGACAAFALSRAGAMVGNLCPARKPRKSWRGPWVEN